MVRNIIGSEVVGGRDGGSKMNVSSGGGGDCREEDT